MNTNTIAFIGLGLTGLYLYNRYQQAGSLIFYPGNITNIGFTGSNAVADTSIVIQNTSNGSFTVRSLAANVYYNDTLVGNISTFGNWVLGPNSQGQLPVQINFLLLSIINEIISVFTTKDRVKPLRVKGTVNADSIQIPLDLTYQIGI